jgi:hypothetical protein
MISIISIEENSETVMMGKGRRAVAVSWRKSSFCGGGACVEVGFIDGNIAVRDSKSPARPPHLYTADEWQEFVAGVKNGEFDLNSIPR